jgi:hypothetical protein
METSTMKKIILPFVFIASVSCTRYQYLTINRVQQDSSDSADFSTESDTLRISYSFSGLNGPIQLKIENKLDKPVFVDWKSSALIINGQALSYSGDKINVTGDINGTSYQLTHHFTTSSQTITASASLQAYVQFIPPNSFISNTPLGLSDRFIPLPDSIRKTNLGLSNGTVVTVKKINFGANNSPLRFRSYLSVRIGDPSSNPLTIENEFFVSEVLETTADLKKFLITDGSHNHYYVQHTGGLGTAVAGATAVAVIGLTVNTSGSSDNH